MTHRLTTWVLQALLAVAGVLILLLQVIGLPALGAEMARELPAEAHMRWPITVLAILGLACVQGGIVCTIRLLALTRSDRIFTSRALPWVNAIVGAFLGGALVCAATLTYQSATVAGPPLWLLLLFAGVATGLAMALLMLVMRALLVRATRLRAEMDEVI
ncbi:DUF2975 domain-containing protein [Micrococcus sp. M4NT]|uniref:DUF2975 domain-containing protein n=1 Tax=Micrococcus sp. M4NT TaxID=2957501 RepID=UPI0029ADFB03|nr:DUF2975 domain-containing protein [Micrococcus sp. M4NT]MDX2342120.1 DUF2975 domain-containing protein [Micrococcus sp. M4NT]